jgi:hypothetical protein
MSMHTPPHPGRIVRQECLEPLGLTVTDAASKLGVSRAYARFFLDSNGLAPLLTISRIGTPASPKSSRSPLTM